MKGEGATKVVVLTKIMGIFKSIANRVFGLSKFDDEGEQRFNDNLVNFYDDYEYDDDDGYDPYDHYDYSDRDGDGNPWN